MDLNRDPVVNVIYTGIKAPVELCINNNAERAALILMYASIDSLAKLGLPSDREKSTRNDYAAWCDKYLIFNSKNKVTGLEWYAARCGFLHNYTAESNLSNDGKVRMLSYYSDDKGSDIIYQPTESPDLVLIKTERLIEVFFKGLDLFIVDLYKNVDHSVIENRFNKMFHLFTYD